MIDEWEAIGKKTLGAWVDGSFTLQALFQAHNGDHRIVATRLWEIFWFEVNGAWDPHLMMLTKCGLFAAAATLFIHVLAGRLPAGRLAAAAALTGVFAFPFGYQNLLWAFQSQFDFFLLALAGAWALVLSGRLKSALLVAALAPFTLGAGALIASSFVPFAILQRRCRNWSTRKAAAFAGPAIGILVFGVSLRDSTAAPLAGVGDQVTAVFKLFGWPHSNLLLLIAQLPESSRLIPAVALRFPTENHSFLLTAAGIMHRHPWTLLLLLTIAAAVMVAPLLRLVIFTWRARTAPAGAWGALGVGGFAAISQLATAIARAEESSVATRFIDVVQLTGITSAAAAVALLAADPRCRRWMLWWVVLVVPGYAATMAASFIQLQRSKHEQWVHVVREYVQTRDRAVLPENVGRRLPILERDPSAFANLLDDPAMQPVMPRALAAPAEPRRPVAALLLLAGRAGLGLAAAGIIFGYCVAGRRRGPGMSTPPAGRVRLKLVPPGEASLPNAPVSPAPAQEGRPAG